MSVETAAQNMGGMLNNAASSPVILFRYLKYNIALAVKDKRARRRIALVIYFAFFLYMASMRWVTRNPPNMFTAHNATAKTPVQVDMPDPLCDPAATAIKAPTIITDEIAFVTAINGVCSAGVTDQTT